MADDEGERPDLREVADDAEDEMADSDGGDEATKPDGAVSGRLRAVRERLRERRARRGSKRLQRKAKVQRAKERVTESDAGQEVQQASDEARLLASELGITTDQASALADQATDLLSQASAAGGGALAQLDTDGDGDTDILTALEDAQAGGTGGSVEAVAPPAGEPADEIPVGGIEDDFDELDLDGVEAELGLETPIEEQQEGDIF